MTLKKRIDHAFEIFSSFLIKMIKNMTIVTLRREQVAFFEEAINLIKTKVSKEKTITQMIAFESQMINAINEIDFEWQYILINLLLHYIARALY